MYKTNKCSYLYYLQILHSYNMYIMQYIVRSAGAA